MFDDMENGKGGNSMNQLMTSNQPLTMESLDLYTMVNIARENEGETKIRLNKFNEKIEAELEGENYTKSAVQNSNNTESIVYGLTLDQCMYVAMRESKSVRRQVVAKLNQLTSEQSQPQIPTSFAEALQLAADQAKQLELAAPKVAFVDNLVNRDNLITATQVGQKHKLSAIKLNRILAELNVYNGNVKRGKVFKQWFIDKGFGENKKTELGYDQPLFTNAGEIWINEQLHAEGIV
jgi:phage antirepressor YoqD-like protein